MYDIAIINGMIVDGQGCKGYLSNVYISEDKIMKITDELLTSVKVIDASNRVVCPAFIDVHAHSEIIPFIDNRFESSVFQGVGTEIVGNCGISTYPAVVGKENEVLDFAMRVLDSDESIPLKATVDVSSYARAVEKVKTAINLAVLVGHGSLRLNVVGYRNRYANELEIQAMCALLDKQLSQGALGLSLGLIYPPSSYAGMDELVALARVVSKHDKIITAHIRNESDEVFEAIEEMEIIAKNTGVRMHISHIKLMGKRAWGKAAQLLEKLYKSESMITCDQYPFKASNTSLTTLIPKWALDGGVETLISHLELESGNLLKGIDENITLRGGAEQIIISSTGHLMETIEGLSLYDISIERGLSPAMMVAKILVQCRCMVDAIYFAMDEKDVLEILADEKTMVASDSRGYSYTDEVLKNTALHPRNFSTYSTALELIKKHDLMSLEKAIMKMTSIPAQRFRLFDRGVLKEGYIADVNVLDYNNIQNKSNFTNPAVKPRMIKHLIISGKLVVEDECLTSERPGIVILDK
jgi:N-acyl-D-amino-acid deacylase